MLPGAGRRPSSAECCTFNRLDHLRVSGTGFTGDSLLSTLVDDNILTLLSRPSLVPAMSNDVLDNATSKASGACPPCGSPASLADDGLAWGFSRLACG